LGKFLLKCIKDGKITREQAHAMLYAVQINCLQVSYTLWVMTAEVQVLEMEPAITLIPTVGKLFLNHVNPAT